MASYALFSLSTILLRGALVLQPFFTDSVLDYHQPFTGLLSKNSLRISQSPESFCCWNGVWNFAVSLAAFRSPCLTKVLEDYYAIAHITSTSFDVMLFQTFWRVCFWFTLDASLRQTLTWCCLKPKLWLSQVTVLSVPTYIGIHPSLADTNIHHQASLVKCFSLVLIHKQWTEFINNC